MRLFFSQRAYERAGQPRHMAAELARITARARWRLHLEPPQVTGRCEGRLVVFTLPKAGTDDYAAIIAAIFDHDPEAEIRTARAHYHGKADFDNQTKARVTL